MPEPLAHLMQELAFQELDRLQSEQVIEEVGVLIAQRSRDAPAFGKF